MSNMSFNYNKKHRDKMTQTLKKTYVTVCADDIMIYVMTSDGNKLSDYF